MSDEYMNAEERLIESGIEESKITDEMIEEEVVDYVSGKADYLYEMEKDRRMGL